MMAVRATAAALIVGAGVCVAPSMTETAVANGDTRTLHLYHTHTLESIDATFRVDGHYDANVLRQLNHFLRDWRNDDQTTMDPRLFDTLWEVYRTAGATQPIQIYSAYRSPETNAMLRRRSRAVAEHSQHMLGKAMDTTIPGFPMHLVREVGMKLQRGGVGWYPSANFVHLDVGGVRSWPRMSYDQLAGLFPDGKTVHIAANGQTLPGYEAARQEIAARGGVEVPPSQESGGFFAWLFGGFGGNEAKEDQEERISPTVVAARSAPAPVAQAPSPQVPVAQAPQPEPETVLAYAAPEPAAEAAPRRQPEAEPVSEIAPPRRAEPLETDTPPVLTGAAPVFPLPPRRPVEFLAIAEPVIPLPPMRPVATARNEVHPVERAMAPRLAAVSPRSGLDAIGSLITKTGSGVPALRRSHLPSVVTQPSRGPGEALAFAPPEVVARDEVPDLRAVRPSPRAIGLRTARSVPAVATAAPETQSSGGIAGLVGLRRAQRRLTSSSTVAGTF